VIANNICSNEKEFVKLMNKKALEIGMTGTTYMNSHGLDEETKNYSTAHDMALLSSYIYRTSKEYRKITKTYKYEVQSNNKSYLWYNRNKFLKQYDYATGGKNGYTPSAGKTLVTTAEKYGLRLTAVTLKDANQYETHANLYDYLFEKYKSYTIVDKDNFEIKNNFYKDNLYLKKSFKYPLMEEEKSKIKTIVELNKIKNYKNGTKVGVVNVLLDNDKIGSVSVYIKKKAQKKKKFLFSS
jgi:serine-type D-Ala-D-Ala carboxypeptidase